ncbi:DUF6286 domain-containing protein [Nocardia sp. NPDC001965]
MIRRSRRIVPAILIAGILLTACVAVIVSLVQRLTGAREYLSYDEIAQYLHDLTWDDPLVAAVAVAAVALGAVLLLAAVIPGRALVLPLDAVADDDIEAGVARRDLQATLRSAAVSVNGVRSAQVQVRRARVTVTARTDLHDREDLADEICGVVGARIQQTGRPVKKVGVRLRGPRPAAQQRGKDRQSGETARRSTAAAPPTPGVPAPRTGA